MEEVKGPCGEAESAALADEIVENLARLTVYELGGNQESENVVQALIPLLERAIFTPDDRTMRKVYNRIYNSTEIDALGDVDRFEMMRAPLVRLSKAFGAAWSRPESARLIPQFIQSYDISTKELTQTEFGSLNEFFYRDIDVETFRPLEPEEDEANPSLLSSMADAEVMVFHPWTSLKDLVVKNHLFTIEEFLGPKEYSKDMEGGTVVCIRLHPRHIHRAYAPCKVTVGVPWHGGVAFHTTKPVGIENKSVDTLCENKRVVLPLHSTLWGTFYAVFVGGPLIGSVVLSVQPGQDVERGRELAYFSYGGSAIYLCMPRSFPSVSWRIPCNQTLAESVEVQLRSTIGKVDG